MHKLLILTFFLFSTIAAKDNGIVFDFMSFLNGKYSLTYHKFLIGRLSVDLKAQYSNKRSGYISYLGAPTEQVYDISGTFGMSIFPFFKNRGLFAAFGIETGYASITLDKDLTPDADSIYASGLFFTPTITAGYRFLINNRVSIAPQLALLYNLNLIDYSGIGRWEGLSYWAIAESFPFSLTWDDLHNIRKGFGIQLGLKAGIDF